MNRVLCGAIAAALFVLAGTTRANTIQPILVSTSGPVAGVFTYTYNLQLTPNNGVTNGVTPPSAGLDDQSGIIFLDFPALTATLVLSGGVTTVADWGAPEIVATGGGTLGGPSSGSNWLFNPFGDGKTHLIGFGSTNDEFDVAGIDGAALTNVVVKYTGAGFANGGGSNVNLINLVITSMGAPGPFRQTLSRNAALGVPDEVDTFPISTAAVPLPAAVWAGFALFGGLGLKKLRRRGEVVSA
jgi:hypothetical protein